MRAPKGIGRLKNRPDRLQPVIGKDGKPKAVMLNDGGGLYLLVAPSRDAKSVNRSWIFRFVRNGKQSEMGLGALRDYPAAEARQRAQEYRRLLDAGTDPLQARRVQAVKDAGALTFREAAEQCIAELTPQWKNAKHAAQWPSTLKTYAYPVIGNLQVAAVDTDLVKRIVRPIWTEKQPTARRLRGRIETVLQWAISNGKREGPNPARWTDHLEHAGFPGRPKHWRPAHHAALPYKDLPAFTATLAGQDGQAAECLLLVILTACRTNEAIGARWPEIDLDAKTWNIPGERMKGGVPHRIPLSQPAVDLLQRILDHNHPNRRGLPDAFVFPGRAGKSMSNMAMLALLGRMKRDDITVHGFRSSFADWRKEQTSFPRELAEAALAHANPDETEAAYARGDALEKRRKMMDAWAAFALGKDRGDKIVTLKAKA